MSELQISKNIKNTLTGKCPPAGICRLLVITLKMWSPAVTPPYYYL
jgi:hypothetical protein